MGSPQTGEQRVLLRVARALALLASAFGLLALIGWASGHLELASFIPGRVPMAPSTALLFVLMGGLCCAPRAPGPRLQWILRSIIGLAALLALGLYLLAVKGYHPEAELLGFHAPPAPDGRLIGHISPFSALGFLLVGLGLLADSARHPRLTLGSALLAMLLVIGGTVLIVGHLLGGQLLEAARVIPPALPTALGFIALGSALLLLAAERAWPGDALPEAIGARSSLALLLVLLVLATGILAAGVLHFQSTQRNFQAEVEDGLAVIGEMKVAELTQWRRERLGDAELFLDNENFALRVQGLIAQPRAELAQRRLQTWLDRLRESYDYERIFVLDALGIEIAASPAGSEPASRLAPAQIAETLATAAIRFTDLERAAPDAPPRLSLLVPIRLGGEPLGLLGMRIDPETQLYPLLRRWPAPSRSAETLLVRREGEDVLFLSDLRHRPGAEVSLRRPLRLTDLLAVKAVLGETGVVAGLDYQGVPSVAVLRAVPATPWFLVAGLDADELYAPLRARLWSLIGVVGLLLAGASAAVGILWQQQRARFREDRFRAELALAHSEAARRYTGILLEEMGHIAKVGGWEFDPATGAGTWTDEVARIHDLEPGDPTNMERGLSFYDGDSAARIQAAVAAAVSEGKSYDLELELLTAKGVRKWVHTIGHPRVENGRVVHVRGSFQDITEQKRAAARIEHLNAVLRGIRDVNQLITREREPARLIAEACQLLVGARGYPSVVIVLRAPAASAADASAAAGEGAAPWLAALEGPILPDWAARVLAAPEIALRVESATANEAATLALGLACEGRVQGILLVTLPAALVEDDEERELLAELAGDIAFALYSIELAQERARAAEALAHAEAQLRQAQKLEAIGQLAGGIAHDFNNLLMVQLGYGEGLLSTLPAGDPRADDVREILACTERAASLTRQLLAFSRQQALQPEVLEPGAVVRDVERLLRRVIGEHIELVTSIAPDAGRVKADPGQLTQVLLNLAVNARDAMPEGGTLRIETAAVDLDADYARTHVDVAPGAYVLLAVSDSGIGMDESVRSRLFEPFFTTKPKGQGTGLGLATVYGIVKQSGGHLFVYSEPGRGSSFKVYLPRVSAPLAPAPSALPAGRSANGELLLLVEDEAPLRELFGRMLEAQGYRVWSAANAETALAMVEGEGLRPALLITDLVLPGLGGVALAERLGALRPGLPVLYISGYASAAFAPASGLPPEMPFLQKPFGMGELAAKVRELLAETH